MAKDQIEQAMEQGSGVEVIEHTGERYWRQVLATCKECGWQGEVKLAPFEALFCGGCAGPYVIPTQEVGNAI